MATIVDSANTTNNIVNAKDEVTTPPSSSVTTTNNKTNATINNCSHDDGVYKMRNVKIINMLYRCMLLILYVLFLFCEYCLYMYTFICECFVLLFILL